MGEPSFVSQPPRAQHQNELLRAGEGVAGQLGAESAPVGFQLCVSDPLQGRRRGARRERGRRMQPLRVMTVEPMRQSKFFPWLPLEGHRALTGYPGNVPK